MLIFPPPPIPAGPPPMKSFSLKPLAFAVLLAASTAPVWAQDNGIDDTAPKILNTQHELRTQLDNPTGEFSRFSPADLAKMRHAQDQIFAMLNGVTSLDQLTPNQKMELSNQLDQVKATLAQNEGNRLICHRERKTGTNLVEKRCETVADREARTRDAEEDMRKMSMSPQTSHGG